MSSVETGISPTSARAAIRLSRSLSDFINEIKADQNVLFDLVLHPQLEESRSLTATALESSLFVKNILKQQRYGGGNKRSQFDRIGLNCIILEVTRRSRLSKFALSWRRNQGNGARTIRDDGNQPEFKLKQYDYFGYELTSFHSSDSK